LLVSPAGERTEKAVLPGQFGCNNEAELHALLAGLEFAHEAGARTLIARGDSDFVVRHVAGTQQTLIPRLLGLIDQVRSRLAGFSDVQLLWIPRHRNPDADRLSRQALGLPDKPATVSKKKRRR
jgi:ribonuclease HI